MNRNLKSRLQLAAGYGACALAIVLIHQFEGTKYEPYRDVGGVLTVCSGITGNDVIEGKKYTQQECDALLKKHMDLTAKSVDGLIKVDVPETTRAALYSFAYNVGINAFAESTLLEKLNSGNKSEACSELKRWINANGKPWNGLITRRQIEEELCRVNEIKELQ